MTDWTNEQINVFDASGNVLVYASAGSGKTSGMGKKRRCTPIEVHLLFSFSEEVRVIGLEPTRLAAPDPKSGAAANYATPAGG